MNRKNLKKEATGHPPPRTSIVVIQKHQIYKSLCRMACVSVYKLSHPPSGTILVKRASILGAIDAIALQLPAMRFG